MRTGGDKAKCLYPDSNTLRDVAIFLLMYLMKSL